MTPEEREALVKARLFFFRSGILASAMFGKGKEGLEEEMATLYDQMLHFVGGDKASFDAMLREKYDSLEKGGNWNKLASAFAATSPPYTRSKLGSDMESVYASLLKEYISDNDDVDEHDFNKDLKDRYNSSVTRGKSMFENRLGVFKWIDDFNDLLHNVLTSEEDVTLSAEDEEKYSSMMHTYNSIGIVVQVDASNVAEKYNEIEEILSLDVSKKIKYERWRVLFLKLEKDEMIERFHKLSGKAVLLKEEHKRVIKTRNDNLAEAMGYVDGVADGDMGGDGDYQ